MIKVCYRKLEKNKKCIYIIDDINNTCLTMKNKSKKYFIFSVKNLNEEKSYLNILDITKEQKEIFNLFNRFYKDTLSIYAKLEQNEKIANMVCNANINIYDKNDKNLTFISSTEHSIKISTFFNGKIKDNIYIDIENKKYKPLLINTFKLIDELEKLSNAAICNNFEDCLNNSNKNECQITK